MDLIIPGSPDDVYTLPNTLALKDNNFSLTHESQSLVFADGSVDFGDEVKAREIELAGKIYADDRATHYAAMKALAARCAIPNQRFRFESGYWMPLRKLKSFKADWVSGRGEEFSNVSIVFAAADPFWYSDTETTETHTMSGSGTFAVDMTGDSHNNYPEITVTAPGGGSVPTFTLINTTDDSLSFAYTDSGLTAGASVVIDCMLGTVTRGGVDKTQLVEDGSEFLRLLSGVSNSFSYTGNACDIQIVWRKRWMIS